MSRARKWVKLNEIKTLSLESVRIKNRECVENIINKLIDGGEEKLQVITDFDRTLSRPYFNNRECQSSFGIFHLCPKLPEDYKAKADELFRIYRPLEIDPYLSIEQKSAYMEEWTHKEARLLDFELDRRDIDVAVSLANVTLRENACTMLKNLHECQVPVLVFSAGLGDTVVGVLKHENALHPNMHVIANFLKFKGRRVAGLEGEVIHSFNKNEHAIRDTFYFKDLRSRTNILLMGDVLGDAGMAEGVQNVNAILKIGFLQDRVAENLEAFMDAFDIVLIDDQTMDFANELLHKILII